MCFPPRHIKRILLSVVLAFLLMSITVKLVPPFVSLEVGIFLLSCKIVSIVYSMNRANQFVFWVLNSIEYRANEITKRVVQIEKILQASQREREEE